MSVWENIPKCKRESIKKSLYRFDRIQKRKSKIKKLCLLQEDGGQDGWKHRQEDYIRTSFLNSFLRSKIRKDKIKRLFNVNR